MKLLQYRFNRKLAAAIFCSFLPTFFLGLMGYAVGTFDGVELFLLVGGVWLMVAIYLMFICIPISYLSDWITRRLTLWWRAVVSALIHGGGVFLLISLLPSLRVMYYGLIQVSIIASTIALCFWIFDEWLRFKYYKPLELKPDLSHESINEA